MCAPQAGFPSLFHLGDPLAWLRPSDPWSLTLPPEGQSKPTGRRRKEISLEGSAARYPPGPPLGKPLLPPLAFQNVGVGKRCICHFSSSSMRVLARALDAGGGGRRPLQIASVATRFQGRGLRRGFHNEEVAGGSEGPRRASLLRQAPRLLRKWCRAVQARSLMDDSVLFSLEGSAAR